MLSLINLVINRAVEKLLALITPADVVKHSLESQDYREMLRDAVDTTLRDCPDFVNAIAEKAGEKVEARDIARYMDKEELADEMVERLDTDDLAEKFACQVDVSDVAGNIDLSDLAGNIEMSDLAGEIDLGDLAQHVDLDELAGRIDLDALAERCQGLGGVPSGAGFEERINEAVSHAVSNVREMQESRERDARESAATVPEVGSSPLSERLLERAVEKLLALADEAARDGKL